MLKMIRKKDGWMNIIALDKIINGVFKNIFLLLGC
jgi:hypothetical protein